MKLKLTVIILLFLFQGIKGQSKSEIIKKEINFTSSSKKNTLILENIYGGIQVEGYNGNKILVEVTKSIDATTRKSLELGWKEIGVKIAQKKHKIFVLLDSPFSYFNLETERYTYRNNHLEFEKYKYNHNLEYKIKVPKNTNLEIRTINNGNISIKNIDTEHIYANNINGKITLEDVSGNETEVATINKNINIVYTKNPSKESRFKSINGDISILFKKGLNADISYTTMNGEFLTNFDVKERNPVVKRTREKGKRGIKFKLKHEKQFQIGKGGVHLKFKQINGDIILKK